MTVSLNELIKRSMNRIGQVYPFIRESATEIITEAYEEGIYVQFSSGYRSNVEQAYIYGKGRPTYVWNSMKCGSNGSIVSNAKPGSSVHNYGLALDYFLVSDDGNKSLWTVNEKWRRVAVIAKSKGFEWGGDWTSFRDYPHIQYNQGLSIAQLKTGKRPNFPQKESDKMLILTSGQQRAKDVLVKHGMMAKDYEINDPTILTLVTMLAPLVNKLDAKGSI